MNSTPLTITVTKEILKEAMYFSTTLDNCAIALAVREIMPQAAVGTDNIYPFYQDKYTFEDSLKGLNQFNSSLHLPENARDFIKKFDKSKPSEIEEMTSISFDIEIPDNVLEKLVPDLSELEIILAKSSTLKLQKSII